LLIICLFLQNLEKKPKKKVYKKGLNKDLNRGLNKVLSKDLRRESSKTKLKMQKNLFDVLDDETISKKIKLDLDKVKKLREEWEREQSDN